MRLGVLLKMVQERAPGVLTALDPTLPHATPLETLIERAGRRMVVHARRWKSARLGLETPRALQAARGAAEAPDALCISLGELSDTARPFAAKQRIAIWQAAELAQALKGRAPAVVSS